MKMQELMTTARDAVTIRKVYSEPVQVDGVTMITAAVVRGGSQNGRNAEGGRFGLITRPVGAYVLKDGDARWVSAVDINRLVATVGVVVIAGLLVGTRITEAHARQPKD